jgi:integrase
MTLAKKELSDVACRKAKPPAAGRRIIWDALVPGFGLRLTDKGKKTFVLVKRYGDAEQPSPRALGEYGAISLEGARAKARAWIALIKDGKDPTIEERRQREADEQARARADASTFLAAFELFVTDHLATLRTGADVEQIMRRVLVPAWGPRPIASISRKDVSAIVYAVHDGGSKIAANRLLAYIQKFFGWAVNRELVETSPAGFMKKPAQEHKRQRALDDDELRAFWRAAGKLGYPFGSLYQVLALTGLRLREAADARWSEIDLAKRVWVVPAARMKGPDGKARPHAVPISDDLLAILKELPRSKVAAHDFLFSTTDGERPVSGFSKSKARLDRIMLIGWRALGRVKGEDRRGKAPEGFTVHDLRRVVRSGLSRLRIAEEVREAVLAHTRPGVKGVYDVYDYLDEKREALTLWAERLRSIVDPVTPPDNIVRLAGRNQ